MQERTARLGRWSLWTLAAALPLGLAALLVTRRRRRGDALVAWWRQRERLRINGHHVGDAARRDDLFV